MVPHLDPDQQHWLCINYSQWLAKLKTASHCYVLYVFPIVRVTRLKHVSELIKESAGGSERGSRALDIPLLKLFIGARMLLRSAEKIHGALALTVKKRIAICCPQPGCHQPNSPWWGINLLFPAREIWLVASQLGMGKLLTFFLQCSKSQIKNNLAICTFRRDIISRRLFLSSTKRNSVNCFLHMFTFDWRDKLDLFFLHMA